MRVGVTGATGFIGRHVVDELRRRGHRVHRLVRAHLEEGDRAFDLSTQPVDGAVVAGLDAVIHAAAHLPASYSDLGEAEPCMRMNGLGTLALMQACMRAGVRNFVHLSTNLYRLSAHAVDEQAAFDPSPHASAYMVSKAAADFYAMHFMDRLDVRILRLGSVFGPGLARGLIATFTSKLLSKQPVDVEDGAYQADFVSVRDVATAAAAAVERAVAGPFNIGSGIATRPLDVARMLLTLTGASPDLARIKAAETAALGGFSVLDIRRARSALDYDPTPLTMALSDYVRWKRGSP